LNVETELGVSKRTMRVEASSMDTRMMGQSVIRGYHIHMGVTVRGHEAPCFRIHRDVIAGEDEFDGAVRTDGLVWGTYIHGVFDEPGFRRVWLNRIRERKGLLPIESGASESVTARLHGELDRWADHVFRHVDVSQLMIGSLP
jgi:adenosylcobyric acid synthase